MTAYIVPMHHCAPPLQTHLLTLPGAPVALAARGHQLAAVWHGGPPTAAGDQCLHYALYDVAGARQGGQMHLQGIAQPTRMRTARPTCELSTPPAPAHPLPLKTVLLPCPRSCPQSSARRTAARCRCPPAPPWAGWASARRACWLPTTVPASCACAASCLAAPGSLPFRRRRVSEWGRG